VPNATALPQEIRGGVELVLADGDRLRVWTSKNYRTVWSNRFDVATGAWAGRAVVLQRKNLECGDLDARTANGAVAVTALCDFGYAEDQAPTRSQALWSADTVTWESYELDGEAYEEPGISPNGTHAVWPQRRGYVTRTDAGFTPHRLDTDGQEYTTTVTITDEQQVSYLYGAQLDNRCRIVVQSRTGDATPTRQELPLEDGCSDSSFENLDADTAWFGEPTDPAYRSTIARVDPASPWAVTELAPATAPGLDDVRRGLYTDYFSAPGLPLYAISSRGSRVIRAQAYDRTTQTWGAPVVISDGGSHRCVWGNNWLAQPIAVMMVNLTCGGRNVMLTTRDGSAWQTLRMGRHPYGLSPDGRYVAVPGRSQTYVISPELGVVTLPGGVTGRCDVVVPDGPDAAILLTAAGRHGGWPTVLQASNPDGWRMLSRTRLPTYEPPCRTARSSNYDLPFRFDVFSRWKGYAVRIVQRAGGWKATRSRF